LKPEDDGYSLQQIVCIHLDYTEESESEKRVNGVKKHIAIIGTLDTKGEELAYLKKI
jgi:hypothetical protein